MVDDDDRDVDCDGDDDRAFPLVDCTFWMDPCQVGRDRGVNLNRILEIRKD